MQVHIGAVEERIAFAENGDGQPGIEMPGNGFGRLVVELGDQALIAFVVLVDFGRHRIKER
ncbi:hypothetical protein ACVIDN_005794 [Rhizobium brockwellii]